jgi:hypothetical protein
LKLHARVHSDAFHHVRSFDRLMLQLQDFPAMGSMCSYKFPIGKGSDAVR